MSQDVLLGRELLSALVDGQLRGAEFAQVVASATASDEALSAWHAYHVVGDVLRSADLAACEDDRAFVARLRVRLASLRETDVFLPRVPVTNILVTGEPPLLPAVFQQERPREGANDSVTRWKLLAGVASMAAVAAIGWHLASDIAGSGQSAQLAAAKGTAATVAAATAQSGVAGAAEAQVMLRDARLDELLAAHKQFAGTSALQMPAGFLRNATFENPGR